MTLPVVSAWPSRFATRDTYNSTAGLFGSSLGQFSSAAGALLTQCLADSARVAALAETRGAIKWINGTTYADGFVVWSPTSFLNYRRKGAGGGTTDPASDSTNWQELTFRPKITRDARTSNTALNSLDRGKMIHITSAYQQTFDPCASLGADWWCIIYNSSGASSLLNPDGSELIDGLSQYYMYAGEARLVMCDGSALRSVVLKPFYQRFTSSLTITTPPGYKAIGGILWGGGESGERTNSLESASKGGGGGGCSQFCLPVSVIGASQSLTIGSGGAAVTGVANGNPGGNTSFGSLCVGYGGGTITANCGGGRAAITAENPVGFEGATAAAEPAEAIYGGGASSTDGTGDSGFSFFGGGAGGSVAENSTVGGAAVSLLGSTINTTAGAKTVTASPAAGDLILIFVVISGDSTHSAPTDNQSGTYTIIGSQINVGSAIYGAWYVRDALVPAGSSTIFTLSNPGADTGGGLAVVKITGMAKAGSSAVRQSKSGSGGDGTTPATGSWSSAKLTSNPVVGAAINGANPAALTPTTSYSELLDTGYSTPAVGVEIQKIDSGDTSSTMTWGNTSLGWACMGVELDSTNLVAGTPNAEGDSYLGGAGGVGSSAGNGTAGSVPGGGGGATQTGTQSGAGGAGAADIYGVC